MYSPVAVTRTEFCFMASAVCSSGAGSSAGNPSGLGGRGEVGDVGSLPTSSSAPFRPAKEGVRF